MANNLHVAFVTSEMAPYVKTGGLADISAALPKALARLGHRVTVVLPRYRAIAFPPGDFAGSVHVPVDSVTRSAGFYRKSSGPGLDVVFVEHPPFFDRPTPTATTTDNRLRFAFLCPRRPRVLPEPRGTARRIPRPRLADRPPARVPEVVLLGRSDPLPLARASSPSTTSPTRGSSAPDTVDVLGLPWHLGGRDALEFHGGISYLKGGILFSEVVNTVSPTYARRDPGGRARLRLRRHPALTRSRSLRDPERRRLRRVGPVARPPHREDLLGRRPRGQGRCARPTCSARSPCRSSPTCPSSASPRGSSGRRASTSWPEPGTTSPPAAAHGDPGHGGAGGAGRSLGAAPA